LWRAYIVTVHRVGPIGIGSGVSTGVPASVEAAEPIALEAANAWSRTIVAFGAVLDPKISVVASDEHVAITASLDTDSVALVFGNALAV